MAPPSEYPTWRGLTHFYAFFLAVPAGLFLVVTAPTGHAAGAAGIYAAVLMGLLGVSALYHRVNWAPPAKRLMKRLDHSMIFVFIAGSFTPFALLVLDDPVASTILWLAWSTALAGIVIRMLWIDSPSWVSSSIYVIVGCTAVPFSAELGAAIGDTGLWLMGLGGLAFIAGAVVYAIRWPNPAPQTFGYHEIFHALVLVGVGLHYIAIWRFAIAASG